MKKVYSKPDVMFESFSLSTSIAACAFKTGTDLQAARQCGYDYGGIILFLDTIAPACAVEIEDGSEIFDGICYHVPTSATALFNS